MRKNKKKIRFKNWQVEKKRRGWGERERDRERKRERERERERAAAAHVTMRSHQSIYDKHAKHHIHVLFFYFINSSVLI